MKNTNHNTQASMLDRSVRDPLTDINTECLALLVRIAANSEFAAGDFIAQLRPVLRALSEPPRQIAARTRVILVDFEFANVDWWRSIAANPNHARHAASWLTPLPRARAIKLARATLMLAWHLSRADRVAAAILMGLSRPVIDTVAHLELQHIDAIADRQFEWLRPRWEDRPSVWRQLLTAKASDPEATRAFTLRSLQLAWAASGSPGQGAAASVLSR